MEDYVQSVNINERWLNNIYENIKKLEDYERLVREGCSSLFEFVQIPHNKLQVVIGLTQFKNLKFMITEFKLLLADLTPILEEENEKEFDKTITEIEKAVSSEKLFLNSYYDVHKNLVKTSPTEFFYKTIDILHKFKVDLFKEIKGILYIKNNNGD